MIAISKVPGKCGEVVEISGSLESVQYAVGGLIEFVPVKHLNERGILVLVDEEGKYKNKMPNIMLGNSQGFMYDFICGDVLFTGSRVTQDGLEWGSLTDEQVEYLKYTVFNSGNHRYLENNHRVDMIVVE